MTTEERKMTALKLTGLLLLLLGVSMIPSLIVAVYYNEAVSIASFAGVIIPFIALGGAISWRMKDYEIRIKMRYGFLIVTLAWLLFPLGGALPLTISGAIPHYVDAFFEMCSGFSTTGSSILTNIESLPKSMLFWRSFSHWLGGMGIIVFMTAILPSIGIEGQLIANAETPGPTMDKLTPKYSDTARNLYMLYIGISVVECILLLMGGMGLYDSLVHTFGTVGTGGFSSYGDNVGHFTSPYIRWVIILFMMMCGVNFNLYFVMFRNGIRQMLKDEELRYYLGFIGVPTVLLTIALITSGTFTNMFKAVTSAAFNVVGMITTTGYGTDDFTKWPTFCQMLLFFMFFVGASTSSTGGGVKVLRILICMKLIKRGVMLKIHPNRIYTIKVSGRPVQQEVVTNIANFIFFYIMVVAAGMILISINGFDLITTLTSVLTCIGNVGPGFGLIGPADNFSIFSDFSKLVLSFLMIAGRLELFTFFMLFSTHYWNPDKA